MNEIDETLLKPTGRRCDSIKSLMKDEGMPEDVQKQITELAKGRVVGLQLAKIRAKADLTQSEMAKRLDVTQSAVSKLESALDGEITLKNIEQYALVCGERVTLTFGKPINHVEAVGSGLL